MDACTRADGMVQGNEFAPNVNINVHIWKH